MPQRRRLTVEVARPEGPRAVRLGTDGLQAPRYGAMPLHGDGVPFTDLVVANEELGRGAFGTVKKARRKDGSLYALKLMPRRSWNNPGVHKESVVNELLRAQAVGSPSLVQTHAAYGSEDGEYVALLMEYMDRGSLEGCVARLAREGHKLSLEDIALVAEKVVRSLMALREEGLVHNDLKPGNILVSSQSEVKVGDFGLMTCVNDKGVLCGAGSHMWMSPERREQKWYDGRSDVYSLGLVMAWLGLGRDLTDPFFSVGAQLGPSDLLELDPVLASFVRVCTETKLRDRATLEELLEHPLVTKYGGGGRLSFLEILR